MAAAAVLVVVNGGMPLIRDSAPDDAWIVLIPLSSPPFPHTPQFGSLESATLDSSFCSQPPFIFVVPFFLFLLSDPGLLLQLLCNILDMYMYDCITRGKVWVPWHRWQARGCGNRVTTTLRGSTKRFFSPSNWDLSWTEIRTFTQVNTRLMAHGTERWEG